MQAYIKNKKTKQNMDNVEKRINLATTNNNDFTTPTLTE